MTTCSSGAALLQRVPIESCLALLTNEIEEYGASWYVDEEALEEGEERFADAYCSDNIFTYGKSSEASLSLQQALEHKLTNLWPPLSICPKSKETLVLDDASTTEAEAKARGFKA